MRQAAIPATALLLAAWLAPGTPAAEPAARPEPVRVVLADGAQLEGTGPVTRRDGLVLFRDAEGRLVSLPSERVARVEPRPAALAAPRAAPRPAPPPRPAADAPAGERYTNAHLPPLPPPLPPLEPPAEPVLPAGGERYSNADLPPPVGAADEAAGESASPPAEDPAEAARRARAESLRQSIVEAEREENLAFRLLVCAQHGIPLKHDECFPRPNLLPVPNHVPTTPTEKSLARWLGEARERLEALRSELAEVERRTPAPPPPGS